MADELQGAAIEDYLVEERDVPAAGRTSSASALLSSDAVYAEAEADWEGFWAQQAGELLDWFEPWDTVLEWELPFAKWFVGGKLNVCHNAVDRHVAAGQGDKVAFHWEGEPGDTRSITYDAPAPRRAAGRQRPEAPRRHQGRPRLHLHADDPRGDRGDAGLRPHRRRPLGGVRRVQPRQPHRPHQRRRVQARDHRRRRLPPRRAVAAQAQRRRRARVHPVGRARPRGEAGRRARRHGRGPRRLVARAAAHRRRRVPVRADGQRGPALPALHLGHHGQAQGDHAHHGRLPHPGGLHPQVRLRPAPRHRRLLVRRRRRLGHRPQLHRLRPAHQRRHVGDVRGHPRHPGARPHLGHRRALRRHDPLHRAHRHPHLHEVGHGAPRDRTTCRSSGCSARSASPSTPRRGSGTTRTSAAAAARSSTRGGRPRPAGS